MAGSAAYIVTHEVLRQQVDESLRAAPAAIGGGGSGGPTPSLEQLCRIFGSPPEGASPGQFTIVLVLPDGEVCADESSPQPLLVSADRRAAKGGEAELRDGSFEDGDSARINVVPLEGGGAIVIARNTESVESVVHILMLVLLGVVLLGAAIAWLASRAAVKAGLRPVTSFAKVAEDIAATGDLERHAADWPERSVEARDHRRVDELDRLSHAFAGMTSALAEARERQRRLIADAGHELRTPLSSLRANIALLRRSRNLARPLPASEEERLLVDLTGQVTELSSLVDDLAELASPETQQARHEAVRLDRTVEAALGRISMRATGHRFDVELEPWLIEGHGLSIERAVVNILDNAVKFSPPTAPIEVHLANGVLRVSDRGPGISPGEETRAFERFWRSPAARSLPGSGLGLSIVHDVAERHGGRVSLSARPGGGVDAVLVLPGARPLDTGT